MRVATPTSRVCRDEDERSRQGFYRMNYIWWGFFGVFVMCERTSELSRGFKEDEQSETGETDSEVAPLVCHQGVSEVERQTDRGRKEGAYIL